MSFIRSKQQGNNTYYYLVENHRDGGKVRQKTLAYLGLSPTITQAIERLERELASSVRRLKDCQHTLTTTENCGFSKKCYRQRAYALAEIPVEERNISRIRASLEKLNSL